MPPLVPNLQPFALAAAPSSLSACALSYAFPSTSAMCALLSEQRDSTRCLVVASFLLAHFTDNGAPRPWSPQWHGASPGADNEEPPRAAHRSVLKAAQPLALSVGDVAGTDADVRRELAYTLALCNGPSAPLDTSSATAQRFAENPNALWSLYDAAAHALSERVKRINTTRIKFLRAFSYSSSETTSISDIAAFLGTCVEETRRVVAFGYAGAMHQSRVPYVHAAGANGGGAGACNDDNDDDDDGTGEPVDADGREGISAPDDDDDDGEDW